MSDPAIEAARDRKKPCELYVEHPEFPGGESDTPTPLGILSVQEKQAMTVERVG